MIEHLLMLSVGWVGGAVSALLVRHMLELDGRRPLDPALLPTSVAVPIAALPALPPRSDLSPYAPKPARRSPAAEKILQTWLAAKQERTPQWHTVEPKIEAKKVLPKPTQTLPARTATDLLPSIAWGTPHREGATRTREFGQPSAALRGHSAQPPRGRPSL